MEKVIQIINAPDNMYIGLYDEGVLCSTEKVVTISLWSNGNVQYTHIDVDGYIGYIDEEDLNPLNGVKLIYKEEI